MAADIVYCQSCHCEVDFGDGRDICEACDPELGWDSFAEEPVWYTLSEVIDKTDMPETPWQELLNLAQLLHDLKIRDTNKLMRMLGAVYIADESKPLQGEYHYGEDTFRPAKPFIKKPELILSNRRKAIMAQKGRKDESS